ncbi:MAG: hypothetical protein ACE5DN_02920, partial [Flavobacteriales bacterium]
MKLTAIAFLFVPFVLNGQSSPRKTGSTPLVRQVSESKLKSKAGQLRIRWNDISTVSISEGQQQHYLSFLGAVYRRSQTIPEVQVRKRISGHPQKIQATLVDVEFEKMLPEEVELIRGDPLIGEEIVTQTVVSYYKKHAYAVVWFVPIRKNPSTGTYEKMTSYRLVIKGANYRSSPPGRTRAYAANSVLAAGDWYKIGVTNTGIFKIDYEFLQNMGMDLANIDPRNIRVYGNGGGMLPYNNSVFRYDDLAENTIYIEGESDGTFDIGDYILFYGQGPDQWQFNGSDYTHIKNCYSDTTYYFITADLGIGKRISNQASLPTYNTTVNTFDDHLFYE